MKQSYKSFTRFKNDDRKKKDIPRYKQTKTKNVKKSKKEGGNDRKGKGERGNFERKGEQTGEHNHPIPFHC